MKSPNTSEKKALQGHQKSLQSPDYEELLAMLAHQVQEACQRAKEASRQLAALSSEEKNAALHCIANNLRQHPESLLAANAQDLKAGRQRGLSSALLDRLRLTPERIKSLAQAVENIAALPDPVGEQLASFTGEDEIEIRKVRVPLGVIGIIYESRPNVTIDAACLCFKSGNACVLKGGSEAIHSNTALAKIISQSLSETGLPASAVEFLDSTERASVGLLCSQSETVDLIIPRGGKGLIKAVAESAQVPVLKHLDGICHLYVAADADFAMAEDIIINAKAQRPGVCNALETLLVDQSISQEFLPRIAARLVEAGVEMLGCTRTCREIGGEICRHAKEEDWSTEYLDLKLSIRVVEDIDEAIEHINTFGSQHSDGILSQNKQLAEYFFQRVDSAALYWNASTRYTDGGSFGFGAEIGISTDKLHARGPVALPELTSYQYRVYGRGQTRG